MNAFIELAFVAAIALLAILLGFGLLRAFHCRPEGNLESLVVALALGLGFIAYWLFLDGILGLNVPWAGGAFLGCALGASGFQDALAVLRSCGRSLLQLRGLPLALVGMILLLVLIGLLTSLAPPIHNDWDSLTYHLAIPKLYLKAHRIYFVPWSDHSNFPFTMEMLYGLGLRISPVAAKLFHFVTFILSLGAIVAIGKTYFSIETGICGALLFASVPMVLHEATTGYLDVALAAYSLLAFHFLIRWLTSVRHGSNPTPPNDANPNLSQSATSVEEPESLGLSAAPQTEEAVAQLVSSELRVEQQTIETTAPPTHRTHTDLPLCGALCGLAMGIKYTGILIFLICSATVVIRTIRYARSRMLSMRPIVLYLFLAISIASPWYVKNIINTGNPVFPFLYGIFHGRGWTAEMARGYEAHQKEFGYDRTPVNLILAPFRVSMWPWNFDPNQPGNKKRFEVDPIPPTMSMIGPALLAFILPALLALRRSAALRPFMLLSLVLFVIWFIQAQYNRYLMPCIGLLAVVAGFGVSHSLQRGVLTKTITFIALLLSVSIAGGLMVQFHMPSIRCGLGLQTRDELLEGFRIYRISREINRTLPEDAKILLLGEDRGFYLEREYMWGPGHHTLLPSDEMKSADDWWRAMRGLGITHCLINFDQVQGPGAKWIGEAVGQGLLRLIHVDGRYGVYALKE